MKLVIPGIDKQDEIYQEVLALMVDAFWRIKNRTDMDGYITDDEGKIIRGF